jgi:hypothetical protein
MIIGKPERALFETSGDADDRVPATGGTTLVEGGAAGYRHLARVALAARPPSVMVL